MEDLEIQKDLFEKFKALDGQFPCFTAFNESYAREVYKYLDKHHIKYFSYSGFDFDGSYKYFIRII